MPKLNFKLLCKGGPVVIEDEQYPCIHYLIGITSFGSKFCGYQQPGVYTNLLSYLDWIEEIVWGNSTISDNINKTPTSNPLDSSETKVEVHQDFTTVTPKAQTSSVFNNIVHEDGAGKTHGFTANNATTTTPLPTTTSTQSSLQPISTLNKGYNNWFNISSTVADLLSKFSFGR